MREYSKVKRDFLIWRNIVSNNNRYFNAMPLLKYLIDNKSLLEYEVYEGDVFYRGRIFNLDDAVSNDIEYYNWVNSDDGVFQGYNEKESGAPPAKSAKEGRLNGNGISFLYTSSDVKTAISELRPTRKEIISVAKFVANKKIFFADLTHSKSEQIENNDVSELVWLIANEFATPHYAGHNYAFTQYLTGQFMNMGFAGVIFDSSINLSGKNYVFFSTEDCKAINSRLYIVNKISILSDQINRRDV